MKLGLVSYSNRTSGVGACAADVLKWCDVDSMLSIATPKGQERWLDQQIDCHGVDIRAVVRYLDIYQPDVVLGIETLFYRQLVDECRRQGIKTAVVLMHESYRQELPIDFYVCPTIAAYERVSGLHKTYFRWPIDLGPFPFTRRTEARRFLHVFGYGRRNGRRQTQAAIDGFLLADIPGTTLTIHCQDKADDLCDTRGDPRVTFRLERFPTAATVYDGFDVLIQPDAYAGLNRVLYEAQACGLPVITTDAPPMNECDGALLVPVADTHEIGGVANPVLREAGRELRTLAHEVAPEAVAESMRIAAGPGAAERSRLARAAVKRRAWTADRAAEFRATLETLCL